MKIKPIENRTPQPHLRRQKDDRCEDQLRSAGTLYFPSKRSQCSRMAVYDVDGKKLCKQHAGDAALKHVIETEGNSDVDLAR